MYHIAIECLGRSNLGSFVKENIINHGLIKENQSDEYYRGIIKILTSKDNGFIKDWKLSRYLNAKNK